MGHWNYRVVRRDVGEDAILGIHEAYYDDQGRVSMISKEPDGVSAETVEGLREVLSWMREALEKPALDYDKIPEPGAAGPVAEAEEEEEEEEWT